MRLMLSTPPARTTSAAPVCTIMAAVTTAWSPPPQRRSTWKPGTSIGRPACRADHQPHVGARGAHRAVQLGDDARMGTGDRGERHDRQAPTRPGGGAEELTGAADRADVPPAGDLSVDLSGQIDLDGRVHGHEAVE